ncbi:MAG: hypothetical protein IKC46_11415 [Lachnospiraceae bacterium]|nr:hypothetical protein [Lachnospiraceae bacterium]
MRHFDEELRQLQIQAASKNRLETVLKELQNQKRVLEERVEELSAQKNKEQLEVDRLEKRSLANYFYQVVGKLDEKLTKEKQEVYEAAVKYDAAYSELQQIEADIRARELEYGKIRRSKERYQEVLKEKKEALKLSGVPEADEIFRLEAQITSLDVQMRELDEAVWEGQKAGQIADRILKSLSDAEGWGTWDMLGGGLLADMAKHSHLDEAQDQVERLQSALRRFKTELADVKVIADMQVNIDGFLRFADYFFDGLFADWTVMSKISDAKKQVENVKNQINTLLHKLDRSRKSVTEERNNAQNKLQELVRNADLNR